jgi:NagD protein
VTGFMIDVQGTLIDDRERRPIGDAVETVRFLHDAGIPYVLVTNNTKLESGVFQAYLRDLGFPFSPEQYLDPLMVLDTVVPPSPVAAYGSPRFLEVLQARGYRLDFDRPEAVLVGIKEDFTNDEYATMIELVLKGARLVGMHETSIYAKHGRRYPGVGAILKMVSFATGRNYEVVGKPSRRFYAGALERLRAQNPSIGFDTVTMISDDLVGDLVEAKALGMRTVLVLSGKIGSTDEVREILPKGADAVADDITAWFETYRKGAA